MKEAADLMMRYLQDDHEGHDHGSTATTISEGPQKPWGAVFLAALLVNLATLSGVVIFVFMVVIPRRIHAYRQKKKLEQRRREGVVDEADDNEAPPASWLYTWRVTQLWIPAFAAGALLSTVVFLVIPEAILLLEGGHEDHGDEGGDGHEGHNHRLTQEVDDDHFGTSSGTEDAHAGEDNHGSTAWKLGVSILSGYLFPLLLSGIFPDPHVADHDDCSVCHERDLELERSQREEESLLLLKSGAAAMSKVDEKDVEVDDVIAQNTDKEEDQAASGATEGKDKDNMMETGSTPNCATVSFGADPDVTKKTASSSSEDNPTGRRVSMPDASINSRGSYIKKNKAVNWGLVLSILIGDGFHNFTDGIFIGNAFMFCNRSLAYSVMAATLYHEFAQEVADFALLTQHCHLSTRNALILNFMSGFSVLLGAYFIMLIDVGAEATGAIMAVSAGVYIFISCSEIIPRVRADPANNDLKSQGIFFFAFALGSIPIGLVLINHSHAC